MFIKALHMQYLREGLEEVSRSVFHAGTVLRTQMFDYLPDHETVLKCSKRVGKGCRSDR